MANEIVSITYEHAHECEHKGQLVTDRPTCRGGVAFVTIPQCIETGLELREVQRHRA